ncbi:MAG TPA: hypothetical protein VJ927_12705 [Actinomycetota bacterium]|nr:hypothetical protein [Actinomycetota bacterium]
MGFKDLVTDIREVQRNLSELLAEDTAEERAASLEIAESASRFSRRTRQVVDDKLSFSATLMRAGEVTAATRLLAEVEEEVRNEEVALIETVNEVKVAQAVRRGRITRLRLARSLAAAMLGASLLAFSAVGMAVAGAFDDGANETALAPLEIASRARASDRDRVPVSPSVRRLIRRLSIGGVNLVLTEKQYRRLSALTGGTVNEAGLTDVVGLLNGALADKVQEVIDVAAATVDTTTSTLAVEPVPEVRRVERTKKKAERSADDTQPADQPGDDDDPAPQPDPDPEPEPSPSEEEGDESGESEGEGETGPSLEPDFDDGVSGIER